MQYIYTMIGVSKIVPPKRQIIKDISLSFFPGAKIGLLGLNGAGKSTVLRIMAGVDKEFDGEVQRLPNIRIGYLPQEPQLNPESTVRQEVEESLGEVMQAQKKLDEVGAIAKSKGIRFVWLGCRRDGNGNFVWVNGQMAGAVDRQHKYITLQGEGAPGTQFDILADLPESGFVRVGDTAPSFQTVTLSGATVSLDDLRGRSQPTMGLRLFGFQGSRPSLRPRGKTSDRVHLRPVPAASSRTGSSVAG